MKLTDSAPPRANPADAPPAPATPREAVAEHREDADGALYGIGELCREFDLSQRALRFYEDKGLPTPRRVNGSRVYTRRDRARLAVILRAKAIGSSLAEIKDFLDMYGSHGEGRTQQLLYALEHTGRLIGELEARRAHIDATLAELRVIHEGVQERLAGKG